MTYKISGGNIREYRSADIAAMARYSRQGMDDIVNEIMHTEGISRPYGHAID